LEGIEVSNQTVPEPHMKPQIPGGAIYVPWWAVAALVLLMVLLLAILIWLFYKD
jgi:hypothetical protein